MTACPVGGVSVTIIVTAVADSGMYFHTLTSIGVGSTGASGGTSACANCTMAGGGCISIVWFPVLLHSTQFWTGEVLARRIFQGTLRPPFDNRWRWNLGRKLKQFAGRREKGGLVAKSPFNSYFVGAQKLNVIPVVAALMVAPPIVSLLASREQTW